MDQKHLYDYIFFFHVIMKLKTAKAQLPEDKVSDFLLPDFPDAEQTQLSDSTLIGKVRSKIQITLWEVLNENL